jgi:hypothetical protein
MLSSLIREGGKHGRDKRTGFDPTVSECVSSSMTKIHKTITKKLAKHIAIKNFPRKEDFLLQTHRFCSTVLFIFRFRFRFIRFPSI